MSKVSAGIDIGSTYTKVVVMVDGKRKGYGIVPTGAKAQGAAQKAMDMAMKMAKLKESSLDYSFATGYGRRVVPVADEIISEISANARGSKWFGQKYGVRTVIDIGGQDSKVISLDENGDISNFVMNDKCAAGTGRFLEVLAKELSIPLDDMGALSLKSKNPMEITTTCLVFAKSEVSNLRASGAKKEDIIAGIHRAIVKRVIVFARRVGIRERVFFDGGPARNIGLVKCFEEELDTELVVDKEPQIVTATGAALLAYEKITS